MKSSEGFKALDKCVDEGWLCKIHLTFALSDHPEHVIAREMEDACLCVDEICNLWPDVCKISDSFFSIVAKDNAARFPIHFHPCFEDTYFRSWHHFAIESLRKSIQIFFACADHNVVFLEKDLGKLKLRSRSLKHVLKQDLILMRDTFPEYAKCITGMHCERDNLESNEDDNDRDDNPFTYTIAQRTIYEALKGKAITKDMLLSGPCKSINRKKFWEAMNVLEQCGKVKNSRDVGGYYRPDSPPKVD
jgi:hypothetical protein